MSLILFWQFTVSCLGLKSGITFFWIYFNSGCAPDSHLWTSANHVGAALHVWVTWELFLLFLHIRRWKPLAFWNLPYNVTAGEDEEVIVPFVPFAGFIPLTGPDHSSGPVWHEEHLIAVLIPRIWEGAGIWSSLYLQPFAPLLRLQWQQQDTLLVPCTADPQNVWALLFP